MAATESVAVHVEGHTLQLTNLGKVLYPHTGTTKAEVLDYYARISAVLLPQLAGRCVTRIRWPHGVAGQSFFEKNAPGGTPSWVRVVEVPTTGSRTANPAPATLRFPVIDNLAALTWVANLSALELHVHQWRVDDEGVPLPPDRLVIDLDPGEPAALPECAEVALLVRDKLRERELAATPVTSGSKGLHVYAALPPAKALDSDAATALAKELAEELQAAYPKLVTASMTKARRSGKVFLDWSQNAGSKTTVAPYSLRGRERPSVATPIGWEEVGELVDDPLAFDQFTPDEVLRRVQASGDLFQLASAKTG